MECTIVAYWIWSEFSYDRVTLYLEWVHRNSDSRANYENKKYACFGDLYLIGRK